MKLLLLSTLVLAGVIWGVGWSTSSHLAGTKPTKYFEEKNEVAIDESSLNSLREKAKTEPDTVAGWRSLAIALITKVQSSKTPAQADILELVDVLGQILRIDPKNQEALLTMGDLSFERRIFDKAVRYYGDYVKESPSDFAARARYASSLTEAGRFNDAVKELLSILDSQKDYFPALAYLSVTYWQMGKKKESLEVGERALKAAPEGEAKKELASFVERVKTGETKVSNPVAAPPSGHGAINSAEKLAGYFKANAVAGPKFLRVEEERKGQFKALFKDFPMGAMPPFAKQKFFSGILAFIKNDSLTDVREIVFIDSLSGETLETLSVQ